MAMKAMSEQEIRERFEALKKTVVNEYRSEGDAEIEAGRQLAKSEEAKAAFTEAHRRGIALSHSIEIGFDLICEFVVDIHRLAAATEKHRMM